MIIRSGSVLAARYDVGPRLGSGGMGSVYRGRDRVLGRDVAIKTIDRETIPREEVALRFEREARVGATMAHRHAIRVFDYGVEAGAPFLIMELLAGRTLREATNRRASLWSVSEVLSIGAQACSALAAAHERDLVHRDIKPENLFVVSDAPLFIKVVDFGLAVIPGDRDGRGHLTMDDDVLGTPGYAPPELLLEYGRVGSPADIYALGCTLFELLTGSLPFSAPTVAKMWACHLHQEPPDPRSVRSDVPGVVAELVRWCLAKKPADRPSTRILAGRLARSMVSVEGPDDELYSPRSVDRGRHEAAPQAEGGCVAVVGSLDAEWSLAMRSSGVDARPVRAPTEVRAGDLAVLALGLGADQVPAWTSRTVPVLADAEVGDMQRVTELLRAGAADVILRPAEPADLVRKLMRIVRRRR